MSVIAGRYEIVRPLGRGGFGETLLATDRELGRPVVLKLLHPATARDWKGFELFEREAAVLRELRHPGIPAVHATFDAEWEGRRVAVLVLEFVDGRSLAELIADGWRVDGEELTVLFLDLLGLLEYLHTRLPPVLHRDIKPANIILRSPPEGTPALVDFGAVRHVFRTGSEAGSTIVGTYGYMPYEQTMGQASPSSDLYALAATMLHVITGRPPADFIDAEAHLVVPDPLPCGEPMRGVLARMLNHSPARRYPSARAVRTALVGGVPDPGTGAGSAVVGLPVVAVPDWPAAPDEQRRVVRRAGYSTWALLNSDGEPGDRPNLFDAGLVLFFSAATLGIMPALFLSRSLARRRRLRSLARDGVVAAAVILEMSPERIEFGARLTRIRYAFQAEGRRHLGADRVLPSVADRWEVGGAVTVLYRPGGDFDSVIVGAAAGVAGGG